MRKSTGSALLLIIACALVLSACGGLGGEEDGGLNFRAADVNGTSAIMATGGSPPVVSATEAKLQQAEILYSANIIHRSRTIAVDWDGNVRRSGGGKRDYDCDPNTCNPFAATTFTPIMTKNGIRLAKSIERETWSDGGVATTRGYGGWMDHSEFAVYIAVDTYDGGSFVDWVTGYSEAVGDAPETNPSAGRFVWNGVMVGRNSDIGSSTVSNVVQGDAAISAEPSGSGGMSVDVAFSNIKDLNSGGSMADMTWKDISVIDGSFDGGNIEGSFFGPQHEEVAGVFERNYVIGAFGARR